MRSHNTVPGVSFASVIIIAWVTATIFAVMARLVVAPAYLVHEPNVPRGGCLTIQEHRLYCE